MLIYFNEAGRGGHFAAWQEPALAATGLRAAFRSLCQARTRSQPYAAGTGTTVNAACWGAHR
jgi:hypothetical protein